MLQQAADRLIVCALIWVYFCVVNRLSKLYICSLCLKCMQSRSALSGHMVCQYLSWCC